MLNTFAGNNFKKCLFLLRANVCQGKRNNVVRLLKWKFTTIFRFIRIATRLKCKSYINYLGHYVLL